MYLNDLRILIFGYNPMTAGRTIVSLLDSEVADTFQFKDIYVNAIRDKCSYGEWEQPSSFYFGKYRQKRHVPLYKFRRDPLYTAMLRSKLSSVIAGRLSLNSWNEYDPRAAAKANWFGIDPKRWWGVITKIHCYENNKAAIHELATSFGSTGPIYHENASAAYGRPFEEPFYDCSKSILADLDRATVEEFGYVAD